MKGCIVFAACFAVGLLIGEFAFIAAEEVGYYEAIPVEVKELPAPVGPISSTALVLSSSVEWSRLIYKPVRFDGGTPMHWSIKILGATAEVSTCSRCGRKLRHDWGASGALLSDAVVFTNDRQHVFFDGCMRCLEETIADEPRRRK